MVVVLCGDVHTETHSAGVDTVQAQGWSFVEREQAFDELEAAKKCGERATFELAFASASFPSYTNNTLPTAFKGTVDAEPNLRGCAHARNAVKESCIYGIVGHTYIYIYIYIYIEKSRRLHD